MLESADELDAVLGVPQAAIEKTIATSKRFRSGPDTDALSGEVYRNGCHLTATGLESAARMWASVILGELAEGEKSQLAVAQQGIGSLH